MPKIGISETPYVSLIELAGDSILLVSDSLIIQESSTSFGELVGVGSADLIGRCLLDWVFHDDRPKVEEYPKLLARGSNVRGSFRLVRETGENSEVICFGLSTGTDSHQLLLRDVTGKLKRERDLHRHHREAVALHEIGRAITSSFDIDHVLHTIVSNTFWVLECQFAAVAVVGSGGSSLHWKHVLGKRTNSHATTVLDRGKGFAGTIAQSGDPLVVHGLADDTVQGDDDYRMLRAEGISSVIGVPLLDRKNLLGILVGGYREHHVITENDIRLISNLAAQTALALENARLYQSTVDHSKNLKALSTRLEKIQEEERSRLSRELHEGIGQVLSGMRLQLESLKKETSNTGQGTIDRLTALIDETSAEIKQLAFDLRPSVLDDFGLVEAVKLYSKRFSERTRIEFHCQFEDNLSRFEPAVEATLYRILQEAMSNIGIHSGSQRASLRLGRRDAILLFDVIDDGIGFDVEKTISRTEGRPRIGLFNMRERVESLHGTIDIRSTVGKGTHIHIEIPV
ncbi:MAG TPA: GAF domain-containing protein [Bacteroidota bacterium]